MYLASKFRLRIKTKKKKRVFIFLFARKRNFGAMHIIFTCDNSAMNINLIAIHAKLRKFRGSAEDGWTNYQKT